MIRISNQDQTVIVGCRFCGAIINSTSTAHQVQSVCSQQDCIEYSRNACNRLLPCGHLCGGVLDELQCPPCMLVGCQLIPSIRQHAQDLCMICQISSLSAAPAIILSCGHTFHSHCCRSILEQRWTGSPRITFGFMACPLCKHDMKHPSLEPLLGPLRDLRDNVRRKALTRMQYEGLVQHGGDTNLADFAVNHYSYYECYVCKQPYCGGAVHCQQQVNIASEEIRASELVCGACSNVARAQTCDKHGNDFFEYKCRYCCSLAVFFCFGTTHFCDSCHNDHSRLTSIPKDQLPRCPVGPRATVLPGHECPLNVQHPATGEEFALGCGMCYNAYTF